MAQRLFVNHICPVCKNKVDEIPDHALKKEKDKYNVEFIILKRGIKQYYHASCWKEMISKQHEKEVVGS